MSERARSSHHPLSGSQNIVREFKACDREFSVQLLMDIGVYCPHATEFLFHGHEPGGLRVLTTTNSIRNIPTLPDHAYIGESESIGTWLSFNCRDLDPGLLSLTFCLYQSGTVYVPAAGCDVQRFAKLLVEQTVGVNSLFQQKTYKNFLGLSVFVAMTGRYYILGK